MHPVHGKMLFVLKNIWMQKGKKSTNVYVTLARLRLRVLSIAHMVIALKRNRKSNNKGIIKLYHGWT